MIMEENDLGQDMTFVNNLLNELGMESPFPLFEKCNNISNASEAYNLQSSIKILINLLNTRQKEVAWRVEMEERQRRLGEELSIQQALVTKYQSKIEVCEGELKGMHQTLEEAQQRIIYLEGIAQSATEEANRLRSSYTLKERQFQNEIRKREKEFDRLKDQLQNCLREPAMTISNYAKVENVILSSSKGAMQVETSDEDEIENNMSEEVSDRMELLENENGNLRQLLSSVSAILSDLRSSALSLADGNEDVSIMMKSKDYGSQIEMLPVTWIYDRVKDEIETSLSLLSDFIRSQH